MTNIPIFLSSDNNYAPFVATTVASICDNTKSFIDVYVLDGGISPDSKKRIDLLKTKFKNLSIQYLEVKLDNFNYRNFSANVTVATYNRFLISKLTDVKRCIYLDCDIIVKGDIASLYDTDLENYPLGAVVDQYDEGFILKIKEKMNMAKDSPYFNAGVLLIDNALWQKNDITEKLFQIDTEYKERLTFADQDILNKCFEKNYKKLDLKYNVIYNSNDTIIRHFAGLIKPWQADFSIDTNNKPFKLQDVEYFWKYAKMTDFYQEILEIKEKFLKSNILWQRYNKMVNK